MSSDVVIVVWSRLHGYMAIGGCVYVRTKYMYRSVGVPSVPYSDYQPKVLLFLLYNVLLGVLHKTKNSFLDRIK